MMTTTPNLDDPRVKRTRQLLQQALIALIQEKSFQDITVQDIAERATVNRATFYAHFEDKYALLDTCMREQFHQMLAHRLPDNATLQPAALRILVATTCEFLALVQHDCSPADQQFDPLLETVLQGELYIVLVGWLKRASALRRQQVPIETTATVVSWAIFGGANAWSRSDRRRPIAEIADQIIAVITQGLERLI
jgi:AcrR family transcriptional regulator